MKNYLLSFLILLLSLSLVAQQDVYKRVSIDLSQVSLEQLAKAGLPIDAGNLQSKDTFVGEFSSAELQRLSEKGIQYEVMIEDVSSFYASRSQQVTEAQIRQAAQQMDVPIPEGFNLGTMGGFLTYDEMLAELDTMLMDYPELISEKAPMHDELTSIEGRPLYFVRLSDNPNTDEDEPEVFYTGMHHAREPGGMMALIFYMYHLLENYDTDPEIQQLVNETEMYFAPCVNPDGYLYNQETDPNGGGMWRKNRRNNGNGSYGVDLNRNYGYQWGYDNSGSSGNPWDATYRGEAPFSEPETQILKEFCENHEFGIAINFHSYSNLLLYTWGWTDEPCEDDELLYSYAEQMTQDNNYTFGPGSTTIYPTNGGSDDWMYGEQETKNKILAFTPEIGSSSDGFWPSPDRIIPHCQENLLTNILAAKFVGAYAAAYDQEATIIGETEGYLNFDVKRLGLTDGATYTVGVEAVSDNFASIADPVAFDGMELMETRSDSIAYAFTDDILSGDSIQYVLSVDNGSSVSSDTLTKIFGVPETIYENEIDGLDGFDNSGWGFTTENFVSEPHSITDSPNTNYSNNEYSTIMAEDTIDLSDAAFAELTFKATWEIESGYDYVQVQASTNYGVTFSPLAGNYTVTGTSYQEEGEPVYDGMQADWVTENISLADYLGEEIMIRFVFGSDLGVTEDGFYFDDLMVDVVSQTGTSIDYHLSDFVSVKAYPNPAKETVTFEVNNSYKAGELTLRDVSGNVLRSWKMDSSKRSFNVSDIPSGMYFYSVKLDASESEIHGKIVIE